MEQRRAKAVEAFYKVVRFLNLLEFLLVRVLEDNVREILANIALKFGGRAVAHLSGKPKSWLIHSLIHTIFKYKSRAYEEED